jgi:phosphatidylglycerophosphate synthase
MEPKRAVKSSLSQEDPPAAPAPGRPREVAETPNRRLGHPLSRALVDRLIASPVTPNQVSVSSVLAAAAGAACYLWLAWPWGAFCGLACWFVWHVLDGADGDLARRTGRASPFGELVDGVCDHASQALLYLAFAIILQRTLGGWAWALAAVAALSHFAQANAYETGRKTYRRWVYGAPWMRQDLERLSPAKRVLGRLYMAISNLVSPAERELEVAMGPLLAAGGQDAQRAASLYRDQQAALVRRSAILGGNARTIAAFLSMLLARPLWFFLYEIVVLNLALAVVVVWRGRRNRELAAMLQAGDQAASAPN